MDRNGGRASALRIAVACAACLGVLLLTSPGFGQMSEGEKKAAARAAYAEGMELQDKGKPTDALARFEAAQSLFDAPTHLLHIAECQALTGKLVEASETYETLSRKTLPAGSPEVFVQAQEQGRAELPVLRARIPTLRVTVKPDAKQLPNLQIVVNEKVMPTELLGIARPVNPGSYRLTATASGWATPSATTVEMVEKDPKNVELVLQQGAAPPPVVVAGGGAAPAPAGGTPPPYEQGKPAPKESPSSNGLLLGARGGVYVPGGDVDKTTKFENYASAGPGFGLDVIGRVARLFLVGGTLEFASLGAPEAKGIPTGKRAEVSTRTIYLGLIAGIMPNVDKVTFVADANVGFRVLDRTIQYTDIATSTAEPKAGETYNGLELGINVGLSIPAGPIRIVPKAGLAFGQFSEKSCDLPSVSLPNTATPTGCSNGTSINSASHTMFNVVVGVYYHLDFSKRGVSAQVKPAYVGM